MPEFKENTEAAGLANGLIPEFHPHLIGLDIAHLSKIKPPAKKKTAKPLREGKKITMAKTSRVSVKMRELMTTPWQFVVEYDDAIWQELTDVGKRALVDHELTHAGNDADGCYLKPHGIEEFSEILERNGAWKSDVKEFVETVEAYLAGGANG